MSASIQTGTQLSPLCSSPIHKLPIELLQDIFLLACNSKRDVRYALIAKLQLVCSQWYNAVVSFPGIWADISVRKHSPSFDLRLKRASSFPLSVHISPVFAGEISCLFNERSRIQHLELHLDSMTLNSDTLIQGNFEELESLHLHTCDEPGPDMLSPLGALPSLRSVSLTGYWRSMAMSLPWDQISTLVLRFSSNRPCRDWPGLLSRCTSLETLEFQQCDTPFGLNLDWDNLSVPLNNLRTLTWTLDSSQATFDFMTHALHMISAPSLTSLVVSTSAIFSACPVKSEGLVSSLIQFLDTCWNTLSHFKLSAILASDCDLIQLMERMPCLTTFEYMDTKARHASITNSVLHRLTAGSRPSMLLPKLRQLSLELYDSEYDDDELVSMMKSRKGIQALSLQIHDRHFAEIPAEDMLQFKNRGVATYLVDMGGCLYVQKGII